MATATDLTTIFDEIENTIVDPESRTNFFIERFISLGYNTSTLQITSQTDDTSSLIRRMCLMYIGRATPYITFDTSDDAQALVGRIQPLYDAEIISISNNTSLSSTTILPLVSSLSKTRSVVINDLNERAALLPSIITLNTKKSLPVALIGQQYYQTQDNNVDIINRNTVLNPLFCPTALKVISK